MHPSPIKPAGFFLRSIASAFDLAVVVAVTWGLALGLIRAANPADAQDEILLIFLILSAAYSVGCWMKWGATPGKYLLGLRVVKMRDGSLVTWHQGLARWASYVLSGSIFGAGFLMAAFHPLKRTIHDLMSGTRVIRTSRRRGKSPIPCSEPEPCA